MNAPTNPAYLAMADYAIGFSTLAQFETLQRLARPLTEATMVPDHFRRWVTEGKGANATQVENPHALPNAMLALNMATRTNTDVLAVMQNLHIISGKPSWSSQYIISKLNTCGRFSQVRWLLENRGQKTFTVEKSRWGQQRGERVYYNEDIVVPDIHAVAYCTVLETGEELRSPTVSVEMAVMEGWWGRENSKWPTMTELMLHYRSAAFFGRLYAPDLLMGLHTVEELRDFSPLMEPAQDGVYEPAPAPAPMASTGPVVRPASRSAQAATPAPTQVAQAAPTPAVAPVEAPAPAAALAAAPTPSPQTDTEARAVAASTGSCRFLLVRIKKLGIDIRELFKQAGVSVLDGKSDAEVARIVENHDGAALEGLTENKLTAVKALLPAAA